MFKLLETLTSLNGPCGYEAPVSQYLHNYLSEKTDSVEVDPIGNVIARLKGKQEGPTTLLTAHIDEVGFIVKKIEANGLLRFEKLGGHDDRILLAQQVTVLVKSGELNGVIGTMSAHYTKYDDPAKVRKHTQLYIDIGAASKADAEELGVEIGTPITWKKDLKFAGSEKTGRVIGKALDDRAGCAVLIQTLEELQNRQFAGELIFLFAVQEEVGLRGAKTASQNLYADLAIAVDTTAVSDTPEETMDQTLQIGAGVGIKVMDFSLITHYKVKDALVETAKRKNIPYQMEIFTGIGTDGGAVAFSQKGVPTGVLSVPSRYAHSPIELVDLKDLEATKELLKQFILSLHAESIFPFIN